MPSTMPRGSKRSGTRKNKFRELTENDDHSLFSAHGSSKSAIGRNRFSPFQRSASRRDSRSSEDSITLTKHFRPVQHETPRRESTSNDGAVDLTTGHIVSIQRESPEIQLQRNNETITIENSQLLSQKNGGIIQNGINYLMMPFQLLHSCVFGTSAMPTETTMTAMQNLTINDDKIKANENSEKIAAKEEVRTTEGEQEKSATVSSVSGADKNKFVVKKGASGLSPLVKNEEHRSSSEEVVVEVRRRQGERSSSSSSSSSSSRKKEEYRVSSTQSTSRYDKSTDDESVDEMFTAAEDSDCSNDQWTMANSVMNMSIDSDGGIERSSYDSSSLEEPMDISMEEIAIDIKSSTLKSPDNNRSNGSSEGRSKYGSSTSVSSYSDESSSSVDDEIARIFQRKCYSSGDESSSSSASKSNNEIISRRKYEESKVSRTDTRKNSEESVRGDKKNRSSARTRSIAVDAKQRSPRKSAIEEQEKSSSDSDTKEKKVLRRSEDREKEYERNYVEESSKRRKISRDSKTPVKTLVSTPRSSKKSPQSRRTVDRSSQTPGRYSRSTAKNSLTPVKERRPSQKDVQSRSKATQTTSIYPKELPDIMYHRAALCYLRKPCCRYFGPNQRMLMYHPEEMDQDFDYVADNEDSNDGSVDFARNGFSSGSLSPRSLTDHYYEEPSTSTRNTPNQPKQMGIIPREMWMDHHGHMSRSPPGFPQSDRSDSPRNQCSCGHPYCYILSSLTPEGQCAYGLTTHIYPRAPTPMRHMYYNFPEFMMPNTKQNEQRTNFLVPYSVDLRDCFERELPTIMNLQPQP